MHTHVHAHTHRPLGKQPGIINKIKEGFRINKMKVSLILMGLNPKSWYESNNFKINTI